MIQTHDTHSQQHKWMVHVFKALLDSGDDIGLATVYRVLTQFESAGLVTRHNFEGGHAVFELATAQHHEHIVCVRSGRIAEFFDAEIERRQKVVGQAEGFEITDHRLTLYGTCSDGCSRPD